MRFHTRLILLQMFFTGFPLVLEKLEYLEKGEKFFQSGKIRKISNLSRKSGKSQRILGELSKSQGKVGSENNRNDLCFCESLQKVEEKCRRYWKMQGSFQRGKKRELWGVLVWRNFDNFQLLLCKLSIVT